MDKEEIRGFVFASWNETDRGYVLMIAEKMSELLDNLLRSVFLPELSDRLLKGKFAPVGTLSAKLEMTKGLGLMPSDEWHNAEMVRRIRNRFAHSTARLSLLDSSIQDQLRALLIPKEAMEFIEEATDDFDASLEKESFRLLTREQILARAMLDYVLGEIISATEYVETSLTNLGVKPQEGWIFSALRKLNISMMLTKESLSPKD